MSTNADQHQSEAWVQHVYDSNRRKRFRRKLLHRTFIWMGFAAAILVTVTVLLWIANL